MNKKVYYIIFAFTSLLFIGNLSTIVFVSAEITFDEIHYGYHENPQVVSWGGSDNESNVYSTIDSNDRLIITCFSESFSSNSDIYVVKYDENLDEMWNASWSDADDATPTGIFVDNINSVYVAGTIRSEIAPAIYVNNVFILKFNSTGSLLWNHVHETDNLEETAFSCAFHNSSYFYVAGSTNSTSGSMFIQKYTLGGSYQQTFYYGVTTPLEMLEIGGMTIDSNGDLFVAATTNNSLAGNFQDLVLIKINPTTGTSYWNTTFGETQPDDRGIDVIVSDGSAYLLGHFIDDENIGQELNTVVLQINATTGAINWNSVLHYANDIGGSIGINRHGNLVITGQHNDRDTSNYDIFTTEINQTGDIIWEDVQVFNHGAIATDKRRNK